MNENELDHLLSAPLPFVTDTRFSHGVMARVIAAQQRRMILEAVAIVVSVSILFIFLPTAPLTRAVEIVSFSLGSSIAVSLGFSALVLSSVFARAENNRL